MSRPARIALRLFLGLVAVALLVSLTFLLVLRSEWFQQKVRERIVFEVEKATGGRAELKTFSFNWSSMTARISPFVLHGKEGPGEPPLLEIQSVEVGLKIISVLRRDVDIELLALRAPHLHIALYENGRTNLPEPPVRAKRGNTIEEILALAIGRFRVDEGVVQVGIRRIPVDLRGENLRARFTYEPEGPRYSGRLGFRGLQLRSPAQVPLALDVDASVRLMEDRIEVSGLNVAGGKSSIKLDGVLRDIRSPRVEFSFDANLHLLDAGSFMRLPPGTSGNLALAGKAVWGGASDYSVEAGVSGAGLAFQQAGVRVSGIRLKSALSLTPSRLALRQLRLYALGGSFAGEAHLEEFRRLRVAGDLKDLSIPEAGKLAGLETSSWSGRVSGPLSMKADLAGTSLQAVKADATLEVAAETGGRPVAGSLEVHFDQSRDLLAFADSRLSIGSSQIEFSGALPGGIRASLTSKDLNDFLPLMAMASRTPPSLPVLLRNGEAKVDGVLSGKLDELRVTGRGDISNFTFEGRKFDHLSASVSLAARELRADNIVLRQNGATLRGKGHVVLSNWKPEEHSPIAGSFAFSGLRVEKALQEAGLSWPVRGEMSGRVDLGATWSAPSAEASVELRKPVIREAPVDSIRATLRYSGRTIEVVSATVQDGAATIRGEASYSRSGEDWKSGSAKFALKGDRLDVSRLSKWLSLPAGLDGEAVFQASGDGRIAGSGAELGRLAGELRLRGLALDKRPLGDLQFTAETGHSALLVRASGELAGATLSGHVRWGLESNYPASGELSLSRLSLSKLQALRTEGGEGPPLEAIGEAKIIFSGNGLLPETWRANIDIPSFELTPREGNGRLERLRLRNEGPIRLVLDSKAIRIEHAKLTGRDTNLQVSGVISLDESTPLQLHVEGDVDLKVLESLEPGLTVSGRSTVDATIRGRPANPEAYGKLAFKDASFHLRDVPNGLDNVSGVVSFFRDRATVENITATTGGGRLTINGFVGYGGKEVTYRLQAGAEQVRVRYPEGVSTTANASLSLTGSSTRSLLSGTVTILRSGFTTRLDLAGLVGKSSQPIPAPSSQNALLRGMQFDVRVNTSADAKFETTLTQDVQAEADLRFRGTPYRPVLLGRVSITEGEVIFFGNRYSISRGDILFLNPVKIEPLLNFDLETRVRGIDVTISFAGTPAKPNVTYRSDPPLQPNEIIALLAVGRAPASDMTTQARQDQLGQDWGQLSASTVVGQALAAPVTGSLQRFFGVSRIKLDPRLTGLENNPQPQLMLEQQVTKDLTFTYITDLSNVEQQVILVEWNINKQWAIQAVRQENGIFGVDILFRKQFK